MSRDDLARRLEEVPVPDERAAEQRAWEVVSAAFEERADRARRPHSGRLARRRLLAVAASAAALAVAVTPPGAALADWLSDVVDPPGPPARPVLTSLPGGGQLLVDARNGPWVVGRDGSKRRLGRYSDAAWSPRGLFVVAVRGRQLVALDPGGGVRWALARPARVAKPAWSPDGFRIAYLSGGTLRVVVADGTGDRQIATATPGPAPSWRPGSEHVVAYVDGANRIVAVDADSRRTLWRTPIENQPTQLLWTADGRRLVAVSARDVRVFDSRGRPLAATRMPDGMRAGAAALRPGGRELAIVRTRPASGSSEVVAYRVGSAIAPARRLFAGRGELDGLAWSPDKRWLLVGWPTADQWLFIRSTAVSRLVAISNLGRQFDPGGHGTARFPRIAGWCCADR